MPDDCVVATGRCVDATGAPLQGKVGIVIAGRRPPAAASPFCSLRADGSFRFVCAAGRQLPLPLRFFAPQGLRAEVRVEALWPNGEAALGDVVLK